MTPTAVTTQIIELATRKGLRPQVREPYRNIVEVTLDAGGEFGTFGLIEVGARTGRVLRSRIRLGNNGIRRSAEGAVAVRRMLRSL